MKHIAIAFTVLLLGCGAPAKRAQYLLRADMPRDATAADAPARIGLGRVTVAPYLDQPALLIETEGREIREARNHQWAEPLADGLRFYLRSEVSSTLGENVGLNPADRATWEDVVEVSVEQLHGTMAGQAVLVATFRVEQLASAAAIAEYRFARSQPLARTGYEALVEAEADLVRELARAIAAALTDLRAKRPGG
jgi:hypothetical protein